MKLAELFDSPPIIEQRDWAGKLIEDFALPITQELPTFDPRWSKIVGTIDARDVWGSRCWKGVDVYAFRTGSTLDAFIAVKTRKVGGALPLVRVWCDPNQRRRGLISALLGFVTKKMHNRVIVVKKELLTPDGIEWLVKLVKSPGGFKIHDGNGSDVDPASLSTEWQNSKSSGKAGPSQVIIENHRLGPRWSAGPRQLAESAQHLGDSNLD